LEIFADGNLTGVAKVTAKSNTDIHVTIASNTSVLAVKVTSIGPLAGLAGYLSDGRATNATMWKCTTAPQVNNSWTLSSFNDRTWLNPRQDSFTGSCNTVAYPEYVQWIWLESSNALSAGTTTCCRWKMINH
jgi:hypothetical protein